MTTSLLTERRVSPDDWDSALPAGASHQIVVGGPGTGKTEFLVRRVAHLLDHQDVDPLDVAVLSFGRRGVTDLDRRIRSRLNEARPRVGTPPVAVLTFHGLAASIVDRHATSSGWAAPPHVLTGPEQVALVRDLLSSEDPSHWPFAFRELLGSPTFADEVTDFLLRASEQLLDADGVADLAAHRDDWDAMPGFVDRYRDELKARARIDYGMLIAEAVRILGEAPEPLLPYRHVLVDEYQDTTTSQTRLLVGLVRDGALTAAADPYQSIYSFRGAALGNVARFGETFGTDECPAERLVLTASFRAPRRILAAAERVTEHDLPGAAGRVEPADADGVVDLVGFGQQTEEAEWIASEVMRLHLEERIRFSRMGVFVRSTRRFVAELSRALQRRGVPHVAPTSRLTEQPAVRFVLDLVTAATSDDDVTVDRLMRRILLGPWFRIGLGASRELERRRWAAGTSWSDLLADAVPGSDGLRRLLDDPAWATEFPAVDGAWEVWSSIPQLATAVDPGHGAERAAWSSLLQVLSRWNERNPDSTLAEYSRLVDDEAFEASPLLAYAAPDDDMLTVATLHQSKGLDLDVVFIADAVEGVFPDLRMRDSLLGTRHLLPDVPHDAGEYRRFRLQEERRLAYTAMTRARRRVVWTATATGFDEGTGVPSRFLALVAGTPTVAEALSRPLRDRPPVTAAEAEAKLRRLAADPARPAPLRVAAIDVLSDGADFGLRPPMSFAGMRRRRPDLGLVGTTLTMSPSQAESYDGCPRRYALERRVGIGPPPGPHAALGSLVHAVLERTERRAIERGDAMGNVTEAFAELEQMFADDAFGMGPFAVAWRRRAEALITRLYDLWPGKGDVVAVEYPLRTEIGGVRWRGVADRIERRGDELVIVDYKTSGSPISKADAEQSLQLGFYLLAARRDPTLAAAGVPTGAEMWFPWGNRDGKSIPVRSLGVEQLDDIEQRLADIAAGVLAEQWPTVVSDACDRCPVRTLCPAQPDGAEGWVA